MVLLWAAKLKISTTPVDPAIEDELQQWAQLLTLRGSPKVIKAYCGLCALERTAGLNNPDIPSRLVTVQMEMRKDLGLSTQNLKAEDLLPLFFADVRVAPEPSRPPQPQDLQPRVSLAANA